MSFTDLHNHLLPGVDDGAPDLATALSYAQQLVATGTTTTVVTPHCNHRWQLSSDELTNRYRQLKEALVKADIPLTTHMGTELAHDRVSDLGYEALMLLSQGPRHARWILLEIPFAGIDGAFLDAADTLRDLNFGLLFAHPERSSRFEATLPLLMHELRQGALLQVNVDSVMGTGSASAYEYGQWLLRRGLIWCLSSDAHPGLREHTLADGYRALRADGYSKLKAQRLTDSNARFLLRDGIPSLNPAQPLPHVDRLHNDRQLYRL